MLALLTLLACAPTPPPPPAVQSAAIEQPAPRLADLDFPVDPALETIARQVIALVFARYPSAASGAGLFDDGARVPSYAPESVAAQIAALDAALDALDALPLEDATIDEQIDARILYAAAATQRRTLAVEQRWRHRPAEWLEPVAGAMVDLMTHAPERRDLIDAIAQQIPGMIEEMEREVQAPTRRDVATAAGLADALIAALSPADHAAAIDALAAWRRALPDPAELPESQPIGAASYAWRLEHALLLPWSAEALVARAERDLIAIDARMAELEASLPETAPPTDAERARAEALDRADYLRLYEEVVAGDLDALRGMGILTVPDDLPPMRARETPPAIVPLTGDGGSMNPPLLFGPAAEGWWNVSRYGEQVPPERRLQLVLQATRHHETWFGPYAAHEGVPGHHLHLSMARAHPDPIRTILADGPAVEGWATYAEQMFWEAGGFGDGAHAELYVLNSWRIRVRRVIFGAWAETGEWTLQQAADWKQSAAPGEGRVEDAELLRAVQWPTQLIGYYAGKTQILDLREAAQTAWGDEYSALRFHDALLAEGPIPLALARAKLLGEPLPPMGSAVD